MDIRHAINISSESGVPLSWVPKGRKQLYPFAEIHARALELGRRGKVLTIEFDTASHARSFRNAMLRWRKNGGPKMVAQIRDTTAYIDLRKDRLSK